MDEEIISLMQNNIINWWPNCKPRMSIAMFRNFHSCFIFFEERQNQLHYLKRTQNILLKAKKNHGSLWKIRQLIIQRKNKLWPEVCNVANANTRFCTLVNGIRSDSSIIIFFIAVHGDLHCKKVTFLSRNIFGFATMAISSRIKE